MFSISKAQHWGRQVITNGYLALGKFAKQSNSYLLSKSVILYFCSVDLLFNKISSGVGSLAVCRKFNEVKERSTRKCMHADSAYLCKHFA